jgi:hypothetical protein
MAPPHSVSLIDKRIEILTELSEALRRWSDSPNDQEARIAANRRLALARRALHVVGIERRLEMKSWSTPDMDFTHPFDLFFEPNCPDWVQALAIDLVEQAIGIYEDLRSESQSGLFRQVDSVDVESAIERALRLSFQAEPTSERAVQDALELIFRAVGVDFTREHETTAVGRRGFRPDFVLKPDELAVEVKLTTTKHSESAVQEEIAADVGGYRTKWERILFVVYDCGVIRDPARMRAENIKHFGVRVLVVKH